jgi:hypothetical protein
VTDMLERTPTRDPGCPGVRVGHGTLSAYLKNKCRCEAAITAHDQWLARKRWTGECRATEHDTLEAWHRKGCRCDPAVAARKTEIDERRAAKVDREPPPVDEEDPDLVVVGFLVAGYPVVGTPARQDYREAVHRLAVTGMSAKQIGVWLGFSSREVQRLNEEWQARHRR